MAKNPPAFPLFIARDEISEGMDLRDYFAAHAPTDIPDWFKPKMPDRPNATPYKSLPEEIRKTYGDEWELEDIESLEHRDLLANWQKDWDAVKVWEAKRKVQLFFQWRYFYADQMLAAREVQHG